MESKGDGDISSALSLANRKTCIGIARRRRGTNKCPRSASQDKRNPQILTKSNDGKEMGGIEFRGGTENERPGVHGSKETRLSALAIAESSPQRSTRRPAAASSSRIRARRSSCSISPLGRAGSMPRPRARLASGPPGREARDPPAARSKIEFQCHDSADVKIIEARRDRWGRARAGGEGARRRARRQFSSRRGCRRPLCDAPSPPESPPPRVRECPPQCVLCVSLALRRDVLARALLLNGCARIPFRTLILSVSFGVARSVASEVWNSRPRPAKGVAGPRPSRRGPRSAAAGGSAAADF